MPVFMSVEDKIDTSVVGLVIKILLKAIFDEKYSKIAN